MALTVLCLSCCLEKTMRFLPLLPQKLYRKKQILVGRSLAVLILVAPPLAVS